MRKFLFIIVLIPVFLTLGHDIFIYSKSPEDGFRFSDLGALWDKYHKESHNQWKIKIAELGEEISKFTPEKETPEVTNVDNKEAKINKVYAESFMQIDADSKETQVMPLKEQGFVKKNTNKLQKFIGTILEQKAFFIFSGFAALIYLLDLIIGRIFRKETDMDKLRKIKRKKTKEGGYKYSRR